MRNASAERQGMTNGRAWTAVPAEGAMEWSVDREGGLVQGPLDLEFLRGRRILLSLEPGQLALLVGDNELQAVYLDGGHTLEVGQGEHQVPTGSSLVFLAADQPLQMRWTKLDPVLWRNSSGLEAIGHCELVVAGPAAFYHRFLAGTTAWDEQSLHRAIDEAARGALAALLEDSFGAGQPDEAEIQARLMHLAPEDLSELLAESGLGCARIAVYTAAPPIEHGAPEKAGQKGDLLHN